MYWSLENVPWTNLHDLNLDWIVNTMKQTVEQWIAYRIEMNQKFEDFTEEINSDFNDFTTQINEWKTLIEDEFTDLQTYVQDYFDNLDLNESTRYVINQMIASGEFIQVLNPSIVSATEAWLASHVTPTSPVVDNTLTITGAAADAKVTGDFILRYVGSVADISESSNKKLANINTNVILNATSTYWDDMPSNNNGTFINIRYTSSYNQQFFIENATGISYDRVVNRDGTVFRPWTSVQTQINTLQTDSIKYISAIAPIAQAASGLLANINDNVILVAISTYFSDTPTGTGGTFINIRYSSNYNQQLFIENETGTCYNRVVNRDGTVYRPWTSVQTQINTLQTDSIKYISAIAPIAQAASGLLANINDNVVLNGSPSYFSDTPTGHGGSFFNIRYTSNYNEQVFFENVSGNKYERVVSRTGQIYRDWTLDTRSRFINKKVYCTGDSIMWGRTTPDGRTTLTIPQNIASRFPVSVTNASVGGDTIAHRENGASVYDRIRSVNLTEYDYVVILAGTNDYSFGMSLGTIDSADVSTIYGAYKAIINYIIGQNPYMKILLITPTFRNYVAFNGSWKYGNSYTMTGDGGYTMNQLCDAICEIGEKYNIPVYDTRKNSPVNELNYMHTLELTDGSTDRYLHLADRAYKEYGNSISSFFESCF